MADDIARLVWYKGTDCMMGLPIGQPETKMMMENTPDEERLHDEVANMLPQNQDGIETPKPRYGTVLTIPKAGCLIIPKSRWY